MCVWICVFRVSKIDAGGFYYVSDVVVVDRQPDNSVYIMKRAFNEYDCTYIYTASVQKICIHTCEKYNANCF